MPKWLFYSVLATLLWAIWGVIPKAASKALADQPLLMQVISTMGLLPVALTFASSKKLWAAGNLRHGIAFAFVAGLCGGIGNIALLESLKQGGAASIVLPLTGVYPLVTVLLARIFLKEKLNAIQSIGIGIAVVALYLFSAEENTALAIQALWWLPSAWLSFALLALLLYGIAGITQKLATTNISTALSTIAWMWIFDPTFSVVNWVLVNAGILAKGPSWLGNATLAMVSIIIVNTWRGMPFYGITLLAGLQTISPELYEVAAIDGASTRQRFWYVTMPLIKPVLVIVTMFSVIFTFSDFQLIYALTHGGPANATQVFATYAFDLGMSGGQLGLGAAVALSMLPALALLIVGLTVYLRKE
jgi:uncharacterized membrane protein